MKKMCLAHGGFKVVKIVSNLSKVLKAEPEELRAKNFKDPEGEHGNLMVLGLVYDATKDNLHVRCNKKLGGGPDKEKFTRRDVLSAVMGVWTQSDKLHH